MNIIGIKVKCPNCNDLVKVDTTNDDFAKLLENQRDGARSRGELKYIGAYHAEHERNAALMREIKEVKAELARFVKVRSQE